MVLLTSATPVSDTTLTLVMLVAGNAAVDRLQADRRGHRRRGVDDDVLGGRGRAGVAGAIGGRRREAVVAVSQERGVTKLQAAVCARDRAAQQSGAVIDLDGGIGLRRAGKRQRHWRW